jgi:hypothetical protein
MGWGGAGTGAAVGALGGPGGMVGGALVGHALEESLKDKSYQVRPNDWYWGGYYHEQEAQRQAREQQDALAKELWRRQQGIAPSVAERQLAQTTQQQQAATASLANSARGGALGQAAAQTEAARQQATIGQTSAGQAATLRAQEQEAAEGALAQLYSGQRQQDLAAQNTELQTQLGVASANAREEELKADSYNKAKDRQQGVLGIAGQGGIAGMGGGMLSDRRAKRDVEPMSDDDLESFLEAAKAYWYRYKGDDGRRHGGVMAQDLGETDLGRALLRRNEDGMLAIDQKDGLAAALASLGHLSDRIDKLEGRG